MTGIALEYGMLISACRIYLFRRKNDFQSDDQIQFKNKNNYQFHIDKEINVC